MSEAIASLLATSSDTAHLRRLAGNGDENINKEVLQQFEALFLQQMLKSMRTASLGEGIFQSDQSAFYRDMYDQQIATDLAAKEVLGISQLINRQLGLNGIETESPEQEVTAELSNVVAPSLPLQQNANIPFTNSTAVNAAEKSSYDPSTLVSTLSEKSSALDGLSEIRLEPIVSLQESARPLAFKPDSPQQFVDYAYELSQPAAQRLGVDAEVIIAIAALETGWGAHTPGDGDLVSNNYFGIKADSRWQGPAVNSDTLEFSNGVFNKLSQSFRAYQNLGDSFNDFAEFLLGNERYTKALEFAHDAKQFLHEIQKAGYATDPRYAEKVLNVLSNDAFTGVGKR